MKEHRIELGRHLDQRGTMFAWVSRYDAEIRFVDRELERFYDRLNKRKTRRETLSIITADHGQGLGTHDHLGHSRRIYNEQIRIPLLFHSDYRARNFGGTRIDTLVELTDLLPTVMELATDTPYSAPPDAAIQGQSLVSLLPGGDQNFPTKYAFSQRRVFDPGSKADEPGQDYALQDRSYKYIYRTEGPEELFDLRTDPFEQRNLVEEQAEQAAAMHGLLLNRIADLGADPSEPIPVDEEAREKLEALGYVE